MEKEFFTQGDNGCIYANKTRLTKEEADRFVKLENIKDFDEGKYLRFYNVPKEGAVPLDELVAKEFNVTTENLYSGSRGIRNNYLPSRQMYIKILRDNTGLSTTAIGKLVRTKRSPEGIDHSTVIYTCKVVDNDIATNPKIREIYDRINEKIENREVIMPR